MDAPAHLVHAVTLDANRILAEVKAHIHDILVIIVYRRRSRSGCRVASNGLRESEKVLHVVDQRLGLEALARDSVDARQEHLVKSLLVGCLAGLSRQLLQLLHLLAVELLEVGGGGWRRRRRCGSPKLADHSICKGGGKLEVGAGVVKCEVDGRLHFGRWCGGGLWTFL